MRDGVKFRGLLPGGASTDFLTEQHLDVRMDFTEVQKAGSRMGTGTMIIWTIRPVRSAWCGTWSISSRKSPAAGARPAGAGSIGQNGSWAQWKKDRGGPNTWRRLEFQTKFNAPGNTFCALAPGAMEPLQSALKYFRADFERHIHEHRCPWR